MIIIGAGMAGLIAGHIFSRHKPTIIERQTSLPNNHEALLRFRSDEVSKATGIPFRSGVVRKCIMADDQFAYSPNTYLCNHYSRKVTGKVMGRSIWDLKDAVRYVAPPDFIQRMASGLTIEYGTNIKTLHDLRSIASQDTPVISTIPMPVMMQIVGWNDAPKFEAKPIWSIQLELVEPVCDVFQTIYYPMYREPHYRASITGNILIVEFINKPGDTEQLGAVLESVAEDFGLTPCQFRNDIELKYHHYGKILPIDDDLRREFIYMLTRDYNIYSLGRFATWKQILLDDVVSDCDTISRLMSGEDRRRRYHQSLAIANQGKYDA